VNQRIAIYALAAIAVAACSTSGNSNSTNNPLSGVTIQTATPTPTPSPKVSPTPTTPPSPTPVPTATPTASPSPSPTPVGATPPPPTPTPTPSPVPTPSVNPNVLVDGGFEAEGAAMAFSGAANGSGGWSKCSFDHSSAAGTAGAVPAASPSAITADLGSASDPSFDVGPTPAAPAASPSPYAVVTFAPNSGSYAVLTYAGTEANTTIFPPNTAAMKSPKDAVEGVCQSFVVPTNAMLTLFVNEGSSDTDSSTDMYFDQEADLFVGDLTTVPTGTPINVFTDEDTQSPSATTTYVGGYQMKGPYALTAAPFNLMPGQTVTLFLGTFEGSASNFYGAYAFFDDVAVSGTPTGASIMERRRPARFTTR